MAILKKEVLIILFPRFCVISLIVINNKKRVVAHCKFKLEEADINHWCQSIFRIGERIDYDFLKQDITIIAILL
jgi:hypothetical protein